MRKSSGRRLILKLLLAETFGWPPGCKAANALGVSENKISRFITGRDTPSEDIIVKLERILGVGRDLILCDKLPETWGS